MSYEPAIKHWFYKINDDKWSPFTHKDSTTIQQSYDNNGPNIISIESGRYDINIKEKIRIPIYWKHEPNEIRQCSWFYKTFNKNYLPYDEQSADILEKEYKKAFINNNWNRQIKMPNDEIVYIQGSHKIYHFANAQDISNYFWHEIIPSRIVRRGLDKFKIESGNTDKIDHLLFVVPGITSGAVLKFRSDVEAVDQLRKSGRKLIQSHFKKLYDQGQVNEIEVLPISWQDEIHSSNTRIDEKLKTITLESLPKFRNMANNTVLDVLSYTSPFYCQNIINTVGNAINDSYKKFSKRHPDFNGTISLAGHSLGGLIIFDLLSNQKLDTHNLENDNLLDDNNSYQSSNFRRLSLAGTGQTIVNYPQLLFVPNMFFALGSPIGLFVALRDPNCLGLDFKLPTCLNFYNIFHPYDPVAYRIEGLINPELANKRPVLIPYHKGGKRKHLEFKDTMIRVKNELKEKVYLTYKNIFDKIATSSIASPSSPTKNDNERNEEIQKEVEEIIQLELNDDSSSRTGSINLSLNSKSEESSLDYELKLGKLNNSKRMDYVLQAGPFEVINEYLFALNSHVGYWESEDTMLFLVKEMYSTTGITPEI